MFIKSDWCYYPENLTFENADREGYNCGGYALGIYKWYLPGETMEEYCQIQDLVRDGKIQKATKIAVNKMCKELKLIVIPEEKIRSIDPKKWEVIAFRYENNSIGTDFHFMKLGRNNSWYEKQGALPAIHRHNYNYVFGVWNNRYNGPIVFMAKKRGE